MLEALKKVSSSWKVVIVIVSLLGVGAAGTTAYSTVRGIPNELRRHSTELTRHDSIMGDYITWVKATFGEIGEQQQGPLNQISREIREVRRIEQQQLCLQVAQLQHTDWAKCLVGP